MTEETRFPITFDSCPNCGHPDTVARLAVAQEAGRGKIHPTSPFSSARREVIPLVDPGKIIGITVPMLMRHFDTCAKCGMEYCTKAEIIEGRMQVTPGKGLSQMPPFSPS